MPAKTARLPKIEEERRSSKPRKPLQQRSRERYELLLDATEALLSERDAIDVGLYDIAKHAKVPPASVYHFFRPKRRLLSRWLTAILSSFILSHV